MDMISKLPGDVIYCILEKLPIGCAVRTSSLSRKWRYMWHNLHVLEFDKDFLNTCFFWNMHMSNVHKTFDISTIVNKVLLQHNGPIVDTFCVTIPRFDSAISYSDINHWLLFLSRKGIKQLSFLNEQWESCMLPSHLFNCLDLTFLCVENVSFVLPSTFDFKGFPSLICLRCVNVKFSTITVESVVSASPLLEELYLEYCSGFEHLAISSPHLKRLCIQQNRKIKSITFRSTKNLMEIKIPPFSRIEFEIADQSLDDPMIEKLNLSDKISIGYGQRRQRLFNSLERLTLYYVNFGDLEQFSCAVSLIRSSPNLKELHIKGSSPVNIDDDFDQVFSYWKEQQCDPCTWRQLSAVNLGSRGNFWSQLHLIKLLLAASPVLDKLSYEIHDNTIPKDILLSITQKLLLFPRASPKAEVRFSY